jgi:hypothetical protein
VPTIRARHVAGHRFVMETKQADLWSYPWFTGGGKKLKEKNEKYVISIYDKKNTEGLNNRR